MAEFTVPVVEAISVFQLERRHLLESLRFGASSSISLKLFSCPRLVASPLFGTRLNDSDFPARL
jgi:hypothetical protein